MAPLNLHPSRWDASYLDRLHIRLHELLPEAVPAHTTASPPPLPPMSADYDNVCYRADDPNVSFLLSGCEDILLELQNNPPRWCRHRNGGELAESLLRLWFREDERDPAVADYPLQLCLDTPDSECYRLTYRTAVAKWRPMSTIVAREDDQMPCAVIVNPQQKQRARHDWAEETACLVSLAQIRGGGKVLVISARDTQVWMLYAELSSKWLARVVFASPQLRLKAEQPVEIWGGWDIATVKGRGAYWDAIGPALERVMPPAKQLETPAVPPGAEATLGPIPAPTPALPPAITPLCPIKRERESEEYEMEPSGKKLKTHCRFCDLG